MENAVTHAVDGLVDYPALIFVLGVLMILAVFSVKAIPLWKELKTSQIESEDQFRKAQLDIERDRELRKMSEAKMRNERELETAAINARMVDAQERSTAAMAALSQQMAVMNGQLELSKDRSAQMGDKINTMAHQVHDIHGAVVGKE